MSGPGCFTATSERDMPHQLTVADLTPDEHELFVQLQNESIQRYRGLAVKQRIPAYMIEGLTDHVVFGRPVGGFLTAVLCNKLSESFAAADAANEINIVNYVRFLYADAPAPCWGDPERVAAWARREGLRDSFLAAIQQDRVRPKRKAGP